MANKKAEQPAAAEAPKENKYRDGRWTTPSRRAKGYAADRKASAYALRYIRQKNVLNPEQMEGFRGILAVTDWSGISSVYEPVLMLLAGFLSLLLGSFSPGSRGGKRNSR